MIKWDRGSGTLQVRPGTRDPKFFKWDSGPETPEVGTATLMNNLLA